MSLDIFFDQFAALADAPNGVKKLRELILQLAVQGKLVPQDPNDEPASVLLDKIRVEKARGNGQKRLLDDEVPEIDAPYELPESWEWARLADVMLSITGGGTPSKNEPQYWNGSIPWASVKDLKTKYLEITIDSITEKGLRESSTNLIPKGRIIICTRMGLGKIAINKVDLTINQDLKAIELSQFLDQDYFYNFYRTLDIAGKGMTVSGIRQSELLNLPIPVPPLAEQRRIVAKIDQLMALCDELEARQNERREMRVKLNDSALDHLLAARNVEEFAAHWQRLYANFDLFYDTPETIVKLRQAILQLAVQGKLVPQDPNAESASVLLEKIRAEKARLIAEGKIKKEKSLRPIAEDQLPFELPRGWEWVRLGQILKDLRYGTSQKCDYHFEGIPVLRIPNLVQGRIDKSDLKFASLPKQEFLELLLQEQDLLMIRSNGSQSLVGRTAIVDHSVEGYAFAGYLVRLKIFLDHVSPEYIHLVLGADFVREQIEAPIRTTSGVKNINSSEISHLLFSLPPLIEQHRIVAKANQLMALCDELETKLKDAQAVSERLVEAVVRQVLAGGVTA